jgi:hypothetical protein
MPVRRIRVQALVAFTSQREIPLPYPDDAANRLVASTGLNSYLESDATEVSWDLERQNGGAHSRGVVARSQNSSAGYSANGSDAGPAGD